MKQLFLPLVFVLGLVALPAHAQNLLIDGDFSVSPGSGTPAPNVDSNGTTNTSYQYVLYNDSSSSVVSTGIGGANGWTAYSGSSTANPQVGSSDYFENTVGNTAQGWIPPAAASNTNGYVVQLDSTSADATAWITGNAISENVSVVSGGKYSLTFSINTETGAGKAGTSGADVMVTNATITNSTGSAGTILVSSATNLNAKTYGDVTGYQYTVTTTGNGGTATTWVTYTLDFTATSNSVEIALADDPLSNNSNISLESLSLVVVPEPRQWSLIVLLAMMGLMVARRLQSRFSTSPLPA